MWETVIQYASNLSEQILLTSTWVHITNRCWVKEENYKYVEYDSIWGEKNLKIGPTSQLRFLEIYT